MRIKWCALHCKEPCASEDCAVFADRFNAFPSRRTLVMETQNFRGCVDSETKNQIIAQALEKLCPSGPRWMVFAQDWSPLSPLLEPGVPSAVLPRLPEPVYAVLDKIPEEMKGGHKGRYFLTLLLAKEWFY